MSRGAFITIEGSEGVGKTTSLDAITAFFRQQDRSIVVTREPGGTSLGETVRSWILDGDHGSLSAEVEALLMFAARASHLDEVIRPALERGDWVICDRFTDASFAYQGGGHGADTEFLHQLKRAVQRDLQPDLTILLDAPVDIGLARIADRSHDHFEREQRDFFERVRRVYLELARDEADRFRVVDASAPQADVLQSVARELEAFCQRFNAVGKNDR